VRPIVQTSLSRANFPASGRMATLSAGTVSTIVICRPMLIRYLRRRGSARSSRADAVNRTDLQRLAQMRLDDAQALLASSRWSAAYYMTGYAVECGLKSCVLRHIEVTGAIFRDRKYLKSLADCWSHDLVFLVELAGLEAEFGRACGSNAALNGYWGVVKDWKETSRYDDKSEAQARDLYQAVTHNPDGVFLWIQTRW
jgi:hypothetical protein